MAARLVEWLFALERASDVMLKDTTFSIHTASIDSLLIPIDSY